MPNAVPAPRLLRSKLFVPGTRPELFAKALGGAADAVSFDLEDAVLPDAKSAARDLVVSALDQAAAMARRPLVIVRVNTLDSPWFADDLRALLRPGLDWINLPKVDVATQVERAARQLAEAEAAAGWASPPIGLLPTIESAAALHDAATIGAAHPRVVGLQLGLADLFEPLGIARDDRANVHATLHRLRLAAAVAGVPAYDAAFPDLADEAGFLEEARMARRLGFAGKSCVHPRQVAPANEVFSATAAELAQARRLVAAAERAQAEGRGVLVLDGHMVDAPFVERARALLAAQEPGR